MSNVHPLFATILANSFSRDRAEDTHWAAVDGRYFAELDAAYARDEWLENRVTELMSGDIAAAVGEFDPGVNEAFEAALNAVLRATPEELLAKRNALWDVFGAHFRVQAEVEFARRDDGRDYE